MNTRPHSALRTTRGFTLIEMMIAVAIIGILSAIALPAYQRYIVQARRADAMAGLLELQSQQERWRVNNTAYAATADLALPPSDHYTFAVTEGSNTATTYTLTATATGTQLAQDAGCSPLSINQASTKSPAACWKK